MGDSQYLANTLLIKLLLLIVKLLWIIAENYFRVPPPPCSKRSGVQLPHQSTVWEAYPSSPRSRGSLWCTGDMEAPQGVLHVLPTTSVVSACTWQALPPWMPPSCMVTAHSRHDQPALSPADPSGCTSGLQKAAAHRPRHVLVFSLACCFLVTVSIPMHFLAMHKSSSLRPAPRQCPAEEGGLPVRKSWHHLAYVKKSLNQLLQGKMTFIWNGRHTGSLGETTALS